MNTDECVCNLHNEIGQACSASDHCYGHQGLCIWQEQCEDTDGSREVESGCFCPPGDGGEGKGNSSSPFSYICSPQSSPAERPAWLPRQGIVCDVDNRLGLGYGCVLADVDNGHVIAFFGITIVCSLLFVVLLSLCQYKYWTSWGGRRMRERWRLARENKRRRSQDERDKFASNMLEMSYGRQGPRDSPPAAVGTAVALEVKVESRSTASNPLGQRSSSYEEDIRQREMKAIEELLKRKNKEKEDDQ